MTTYPKNHENFKNSKDSTLCHKVQYYEYNMDNIHSMKSVDIWSFSGPYFPAFGLNTERYSASVRIQSECGKIWT